MLGIISAFPYASNLRYKNDTYKMKQSLIFLCLLLLFLACNSQSSSQRPLIVKGEIRYLADTKRLNGEIYFFRGDSLSNSEVFRPAEGSVAFLGSAMQADELGTRQRWRSEMKVAFPEELRFTFPTSNEKTNGAEKASVRLQFSPPHIDSLPAKLLKSEGARFSAGHQALAADENIVVFFEPENRSQSPRRIVVAGPTSNDKISLPANTLESIPPGQYQVYLVKQKLAKSTQEGVSSAIQLAYHSRSKSLLVE